MSTQNQNSQITLPIPTALKKYEQLTTSVDTIAANLQQAELELELATEDYQTAKDLYDRSLAKKSFLEANRTVLTSQKSQLDTAFNQQKADSQGNINTFRGQLNDATNRLNAESNSEIRNAILAEINLYYIQIQQEQNILSVEYSDYIKNSDILNFQTNELNNEIQALASNTIVNQKSVIDAKNNTLSKLSNEVNSYKQALETAGQNRQKFLTENTYLLSQDHSSNLLKNTVDKVNQKLTTLQAKLEAAKKSGNSIQVDTTQKQVSEQQLFLQELKQYHQTVKQIEDEFKSERTTIQTKNSQIKTSVSTAIKTKKTDGYINLVSKIGTGLQGIIPIWIDNLQDNHSLTTKVWNTTQNYSKSFDSLTTYIGKTLADPQSAYLLNQLQLEEAIKKQETTSKRRDALAESVDYVEDSIALYRKQIEEIEELGKVVQNLQELTTYEKQYTDLQKDYRTLEEKWQNLQNDYNYKIGIRQQKEQALAQEQQDYINGRFYILPAFPNNGYGVSTNNFNYQTGDFNGDGKTDLIHFVNNDYVNVWLSNGNGTFDIRAAFPNNGYGVSTNNFNYKTGDFNGDGKTDLIHFVNNDYVNVWLSNGNGTFDIRAAFPNNGYGVSTNNFNYKTGDFNGDGRTDLIHFVNNDYVNVWLSNGDGTFDIRAAFPNNGYGVSTNNFNYKTGDFNGDGRTDLIHFVNNDYVNVWLSNGDGTFDIKAGFPNNSYGVSGNNYNYQTGDFNGDGRTDLIHFVNNDYVNVWLSNGNGTFDIRAAFPNNGYGVSTNNFNYKTGDFNGDGRTDLIHFVNNNYVNLWISNGEGTFTIKTPLLNSGYGVAANNYNYQIGDFSGDRSTDLVHFVDNNYVHIWQTLAQDTINQKLSNAQQELQAAINNENTALQVLQALPSEKNSLNNSLNQLNPLLTHELVEDINSLPQRYALQSDTFKNYVWQRRDSILQNPDSAQKIAELEKLRLEVAYLDLLEEKEPAKLQAFLQEYSNGTPIEPLRNKYLPGLNNAQTLDQLQQKFTDVINTIQSEIQQRRNSINQKQAQAAAAEIQADWYEKEAATHWELSRKQGPTWVEYRTYKKKGLFGSKTKTEAITHVDHHWIIWDTFTKQATAYRKQAEDLIKGAQTDTTQQDTTKTILEQWNQTKAIADKADITQTDLINLLNTLETNRQLNTNRQAQIIEWEQLLPTLKNDLNTAIIDANTATAKVQKEWTEYQDSEGKYQTVLNDILKRRAELQTQAQQFQQTIAEAERWTVQQNANLTNDINRVKTLISQLQSQHNTITKQLTTAKGETQTNLFTQQALLDYNIKLLTQQQTVLTSEQATLIQKQTLLGEQKQLLETGYQLLDAYLASPDDDFSNLEALFADTKTALAEIDKLAKQAEASSQKLSKAMADLQVFLKLQNDHYLDTIKDKQEKLQQLIEATKLKENYTLQATQKRQELNGIETQFIDILKKANQAGSKEAAKLLQVASAQNMEEAAKLYYRDYRDLANDKGGRCAGGLARPEDLKLADYYYNQMIKYKQLKDLAQQQANEFASLRGAAETQLNLVEQQKATAEKELADLQKSIGNTQTIIDAKQQELNLAQFRIDTLDQLRQWTEQTLSQLLAVEQLNLAQAKLEQEIAQNRQEVIDEEVKNRLERERLDIERDRQIALVKIQQLNQLQTEEALQGAINQLLADLNLNPIEDIIQLAEWKGQLAGLSADLLALKKQPELPANLRNILDSTLKEISQALEGKETKTIQNNLLTSSTALIEQANNLKKALDQLDREEQKYLLLLSQSDQDLQGATKILYDEIQKTGVLADEKELLTQENLKILYQVAHAKEAGTITEALAKQSKDLLEQIIDSRIQERKTRNKAVINEIISTISTALQLVGTILSFTPLAPIGQALSLVSQVISAAQAAYNGDWAGAVFNTAMAVTGYQMNELKGSLDNAQKVLSKTLDEAVKNQLQTQIVSLKDSLTTLQTFRATTQGVYNTYQAIQSKDNILALLSAVQGVANITTSQLSYGDTIDKTKLYSNLEKAFITAGQLSVTTYQTIQAIQAGNIDKALQSLIAISGKISENFAEELKEQEYKNLRLVVTAGQQSAKMYAVAQAIDKKDWLEALKGIRDVAKPFREIFKDSPSNTSQNPSGNNLSPTNELDFVDKVKNLADKFEEYTDKLEKHIKDTLGLDIDQLKNIYKTASAFYSVVKGDLTLQDLLAKTKETLNLWKKEIDRVELKTLNKVIDTATLLANTSEQGGTNAWLSGINEGLGIWRDEIQETLDQKFYNPEVLKLSQELEIRPEKLSINAQGEIYFTISSNLKILVGITEAKQATEQIKDLSIDLQDEALRELPDQVKAEVIANLRKQYPTKEAWLKAYPILVADNGTAYQEILLSQRNLLDQIYPETKVSNYDKYTIKSGDNISKIAKNFLADEARSIYLLTENGSPLVGNSTQLKPGQTVLIPKYEYLQKQKQDELDKYLQNPKIKAFLDTIASAEGTDREQGYSILFGGDNFTGFNEHPNKDVTKKSQGKSLTSDAAGRYQIRFDTWQVLQKKIFVERDKKDKFSPLNQDRAAVQQIKDKGALDDILKDDLNQAFKKLNRTWASFPGSPYGQPTKNQADLDKYYQERLKTYSSPQIIKKQSTSSNNAGLIAIQTSTIDLLTGTYQTASLVGTDSNRLNSTQMGQASVVHSSVEKTNLDGLSEMNIYDYLESSYMTANYSVEPNSPFLPTSSFSLSEITTPS